MSAIKKTVTIEESIVKEASSLNSNFSAVVEAALIEYIHHHRVQKAIKSFGSWDKRSETTSDFIKNLRQKDDRKYVTRNDKKIKKN